MPLEATDELRYLFFPFEVGYGRVRASTTSVETTYLCGLMDYSRRFAAVLYPRDGFVVRPHREVVGTLLTDLPDLLPLHPLFLKRKVLLPSVFLARL